MGCEIEHTHKKQSGGSGQFAEIKGGAVPKEYIPGVAKGLESVMTNGVLAGFPVIGCKATLLDGAFHDVDSSVMAFEIAGRAQGLARGGREVDGAEHEGRGDDARGVDGRG